jgi:hypothetical protein
MEHEKARTRRPAAPDGDASRTRRPRAVFAPFALVAVLSRKTGATTPTKSDDRHDRRVETTSPKRGLVATAPRTRAPTLR